ncbi:hypothetical protein [Peterkaempfera sp. SMS 1(5)a]|uniref:hypothetical protein n=1 Tax=Peterkaempfera podocarpi TaxID=3232308 RepID=UPI00366DDBD6
MSSIPFVADHQRRYGVKRLGQVLEMPRSSYCHGRRSEPVRAARRAADARPTAGIRAVHQPSGCTYGVARITAGLRDRGPRRSRVSRLRKDAAPGPIRCASPRALQKLTRWLREQRGTAPCRALGGGSWVVSRDVV